MRRRSSLVQAAVLIALATACKSETRPVQSGQAARPQISDAVHSFGLQGFFFLPPMVPQPPYTGAFEAGLSPTVRIDEVDSAGNTLQVIATFTTTSGPGSETVRVVPTDEHYIVNWHTDDFALSTSAIYRIRVLLPGRELGFADVDVVGSGKDLRNVDTNELVPLLNGRTLPIKFRVEEGAPCTGITCTALSECHDVGACDPLTAVCSNPPKPADTPCVDDGKVCTTDLCDGNGTCVHAPGNEGAVCRDAAGVCDIAERCDGLSDQCPGDAFQGPAVECRPAAGPCDLAEECTGTSAHCPGDLFKPATYECRASAGICDVPENCTGTGPNCPDDLFKPATYECRASAGLCDVPESCTGTGPNCPGDVFQAPIFACRLSTGPCDPTEFCTGLSATCPTDVNNGGLGQALVQPRVMATISVGLGPTGLGVNSSTNRVYVTNAGSNTVSVIDSASDSVGATIAGISQGLAASANPVSDLIYVVSQFGNESDNVFVINGVTGDPYEDTLVATIPTPGRDLDNGRGIGVNPVTNRVYVPSFGPEHLGGKVLVVDGKTNTLQATISVAAKPFVTTVNPVTNQVYVGHNAGATLTKIDGATNTVSAGAGVSSPHNGIGVDFTTNRIFVHRGSASFGELVVIDGTTDLVITSLTLPVGEGPVHVDETTHRVYVSNQDSNMLSVIDGTPGSPTENEVVATIPVGASPRGVGLDATLRRLYVASNPENAVYVVADPLCGLRKIAFVSTRDGNEEIYSMNPDGSDVTRLTNNTAAETSPAWSPDGTKIAFSSNRDGNFEIYVMNADGTGQTRLTNNAGASFSPTWSPDGMKIAFYDTRDHSQGEIYSMNADGTGVTRLTNNTSVDEVPDWSPDGTKIAFSSSRTCSACREVFVMNADGTGPTQLTFTGEGVTTGSPRWSPDGTKIVFNTNADGDHEIYVMNADGSAPTKLTNNADDDNGPAWSLDGTRIVFQSSRDGNAEIYVMNADGTNPTRLTSNGVSDGAPHW